MASSQTNCLPQAAPPNTITLGLGVEHQYKSSGEHSAVHSRCFITAALGNKHTGQAQEQLGSGLHLHLQLHLVAEPKLYPGTEP